MGENARRFDFLGEAQPVVLKAVRDIADVTVDDPELLARLLDGHAGHDLQAKGFGLEAEVRELRKRLAPLLASLRVTTEEALRLPHQERELNGVEVALSDLVNIDEGLSRRREIARTYLAALEIIRSTPFKSDLAEFGGKPENDISVTRIVTAVADYCWHKGIDFTGAPRRGQADNRPFHPVKSYAAKLTAAALRALGVACGPAELATHMNKARRIIADLRGTTPAPAN